LDTQFTDYIHRYHEDSESENREGYESEEEESEGTEEGGEEDGEGKENGKVLKEIKPIGIHDEDETSRYAKCENCGEGFDVTTKERECAWHPGIVASFNSYW
jgi:hypothetical protein